MEWKHEGTARVGVEEHACEPRVLFLTVQYLPFVGGAELRSLREAQSVQARGHDVQVLTLRLNTSLPPCETIEGVPVKRIGGQFVRGRLRLRFGAQWLVEWRIFRELVKRREEYEVLHLRQLEFLARPAALACALVRKPLVVRVGSCGPGNDVHLPREGQVRLYAGALDPAALFLRAPAGRVPDGDLGALRRAQWLWRVTLRLVRRRGTRFTAISSDIAASLRQVGIPARQIVSLPNGIDLDVYQTAATQVAVRMANPPPAIPTVVSVSRFRYEKGLDVLLHAWRDVHAQFPAARLVLIGGGPLRPNFEALAAALGISESVELVDLVGDVRNHLAAADVFVLPSRWEGMPNALLEAMACGLPCVATRVSGSVDAIVDAESGLLVPPEHPAALADALCRLLSDRSFAQRVGVAARQRVNLAYNQRTLTDQLATLYREVAGIRTGAREETRACAHARG